MKNLYLVPYHKFSYSSALCIVLGFLFVACNTTRHLDEGEFLVVDNKVRFSDKSDLSKEFGIESTLEAIVKQQPNTRYLGIKREWLFFKSEAWKNKGALRSIAEKQGQPPVIYSDSLTHLSEQTLKNYLFNNGYFQAEVSSKVELKRRKAKIRYDIRANAPYAIDEIRYIAKDTSISDFLDSLEKSSLLTKGDMIKDVTYQLEKSRITEAFLNNGYADFYPGLISPLRLDTTGGRNQLTLEIFSLPGKKILPKKKVGNIRIYSDYSLSISERPLDTLITEGVTCYLYKEKPSVQISTILDKVYLKPGALTSKDNFDNTYRGLSDLGVFKFISLTPLKNNENPDLIDFNIQVTPDEKRVFDTGLDFNYSTSPDAGGRNLFGLTGSAVLENRNLFRKAINLTLKGEVGAEINLNNIDSFNTFSTNFEAIVNIPRFTGFPGTLRFLSLIKLGDRSLIHPTFYQNIVNRGSTRLSGQHQVVFISDFYNYTIINLNYGYDVPIDNRKRYQINTIGINFYRPDTLSQFSRITQNQEYILRSFIGNRLFTGLLYRDFNFYYKSKSNIRGNYWIVNIFNEVSGLEVSLVNNLYNAVTNKDGKFVLHLDRDIDFARFTRFEFQYRYYFQLGKNKEVAFRFNPAVAITMDTFNVPFVKQYYVGGPQSMRAWQIRELGPGANPISSTIQEGHPYFSSGDLKLEFNLEYRFDLFWKFKSALFLDAGNVWLLSTNKNEPGQFTKDFWKQIAIGTGVGLRFDADFVLFRLDMGYKLRNPYKDEEGSFVPQMRLGTLLQDFNYNLAIGYPF